METSPVDQLKKAMEEMQKQTIPQLSELRGMMEKSRAWINPVEKKNVVVNDVHCVMEVYSDGKVAIMFPSVPDANEFYNTIQEKPNWFQKIFKRK